MDFTHERDVLKLDTDKCHLTNNNELLPEVVWRLVLSKIRNPIDIESCSNASPYFWEFLKTKRRTEVAVPIVLQQLFLFFNGQKSDSNGNGSDSEDDETESSDDERSSQKGFFSVTNFWALREICKSWNTTIEHIYHAPGARHFRMRDDMANCRNDHMYCHANDIFDPEMLPQEFLQKFDNTHYDLIRGKPKKNPFLGRNVQFRIIYPGDFADDEDRIYLDGIFQMLRKYGAEIHYVLFDFFDMDGTNLVQIYDCFVAFLKLMPNLKVLRVTCERENFDEDENFELGVHDVRRWTLRQLRNQIIENPIPTLKHLEYLSTTDLPSRMFNELLKKNRHIDNFQVDRQRRHSSYSMFNLHLPNLNVLGVTFCSIKDFEKFEQWKTRFQLQKFYFWYNGPPDILSWSRLFRALGRQLGEYCTELLVEMPLHKTEYQSIQTFNDTHSGRLSLPNLQQITIKCDSAISLDFLLPAKHSVRTIFIRYSDGHSDEFLLKRFADYEEQQFVKFIGFKDRMEDSNIWDEFPMPENVTLFCKKEMGGCVSYIRRTSREGESVLEKNRWYRETI